MDLLALIQLQLHLECIRLNSDGFLVPVPCPQPDDIFRFSIYRHPDGYQRFFRYDLPAEERRKLAEIPPEIAMDCPERVQAVLADAGPCNDVFRGSSYVFPDRIRPRTYPDAVPGHELEPLNLPGLPVSGQSLYAVVVDGQVVSTCESSRENGSAAEAWVQTLPAFRRNGYAGQVTLAWADQLVRRGKQPFYSHKWNNRASEGLARRLELIWFANVVGYL